jgi:hypothetical protein
MNSLWPAWKVAVVAAVVAFIALIVAGVATGGLNSSDPHAAGERFGEKYGLLVLLAPVVGYIVQKWRIDRHGES